MKHWLTYKNFSRYMYLSLVILFSFNIINSIQASNSSATNAEVMSEQSLFRQQHLNSQHDSNSYIDDNHHDELNDDESDPLEGFNRTLFGIHRILDGMFFKPMAEIYDLVVHPYVKERVHNALQNLRTPGIFINDCLQGNGENARQSFIRFFLNSTLGGLGLYDFARDVVEIKHHQADFGQTMLCYGVKTGPYLFIPILGPTNFRDFIGMVVDLVVDPVNMVIRHNDKNGVVYVRTGVDAVDQRTRLLDTTHSIDTSYDPYVNYKSLHTQNRQFNVSNGEIDMDTPTPDDE